MIYRVAEQQRSTGFASQEPSETSEASVETVEEARLVPSRHPLVHQKANASAISQKPRLSYIESTDGSTTPPFEEIVIRAETYFPSWTNIAEGGYQTSQRETAANTKANRRLSSAELKQRNERDIDQRILMTTNATRKPRMHFFNQQQPQHQTYQHPSQDLSNNNNNQNPPIMHYGGCYSQPMSHHQQPMDGQMVQETEPEERTTYDYRNFQVARQRFEQRGIISQAMQSRQPMQSRTKLQALQPFQPQPYSIPANTGSSRILIK